jgi:signal transduction histidine kinase/CheY-like chemotaxis protein
MEVTDTFLDNLDRLGAWGILTTDENLIIVGWNRWLERHSGKRAADVIGKPLLEVFEDISIRSLDRYYREALEGRSAILSQRFHKYLLAMPPTVATSQLMHMQQTARISPMFDGGSIRGTLTVIEDVTERVVTEFELRKQAERLEEANRHKDEFLAMLAHELRNPLAPIRNGIRVLDIVGASHEEARETREMIERQVSHMARLVDDLLDVSRIIRGKVRIQAEPCDLVAVLQQVAADYRPILADNGVHLSIDLPTDPCWMMGDGIRLAQIVANLLHNASKFTNKDGEVTLSAKVLHESSSVMIRVKDTGVGMSPETLSHIFESFSQAETTIDRSKGGLGLGLALVKGLTELHGGTVEATSDGLGKGAEFTVRIPIKTATPIVATPTRRQPNLQESKRVLLIEDNRDAAQTMRLLLQHYGFEVEIAYTGPEGVSVAQSWGPDVVICDIGLPDLDGFGVARALRSNAVTREAFLIAQSGYGQAEDIRKGLDAGFDLHLIKPVDFSRLEEALQTAPRNTRIPIDA